MVNKALLDLYRCPEAFAEFELTHDLSEDAGFFRFGSEATCFGRTVLGSRARPAGDGLYDVLPDVRIEGSCLRLPFHPDEVVENLRRERYIKCLPAARSFLASRHVRNAYYFLRPLLPVAVRRYLQKIELIGWKKIPFPRWPVDLSVDLVLNLCLALAMKSRGVAEVPFIWFWPDGAQSCVIMTHDVETAAGRDFCRSLMSIDESFGIRSSFQLIPEVRYEVPASLLQEIRGRGFELNLHDLNHDGHLYSSHRKFLQRAERINAYVRKFGCEGFRAGAMYRNQAWYEAFEFSYDMSVPNVAHLEPQRGGCCTVLPYFVGKILEIPLTTIQDYSLFHIFKEYSIEQWKLQMQLILKNHGLVSFIAHPDYLVEPRAQQIYRALLAHIAATIRENGLWMTLPGEVNRWWRERSQSQIICQGNQWQIEGPAKNRGRVAFARWNGEALVYSIAEGPTALIPGVPKP
jgi:hypothetical protein